MNITFGTSNKGKSVEFVVLKDPAYVQWALGEREPGAGLAKVQTEMLRIIEMFDLKPIVAACSLPGCKGQATRFSVHGGIVSPLYTWCDVCDPNHFGATAGSLEVFKGYRGALKHVSFWCNGRAADYRAIIKEMSIRKGFPTRGGGKQIAAFFS